MTHGKSKQKTFKKKQTKYPKIGGLQELLICASFCMQALVSSSGSENFKNWTTFEIIKI